MSQNTENPFAFTDSNKRYHTYDYYLRTTYGQKCAKIPLDIGCTCPNIDGRCGAYGCIYCSPRGSGDFAAAGSVSTQIEAARAALGEKWKTARIIPYFQAHTNTYGDLDVLARAYEEALAAEGVVGLHIATRADCLPDEILRVLADLAGKTVLTVELGLQTAFDETAAAIGRGHTFADFTAGYRALREASDKIRIGVHLINGLPGETPEMMLESAAAVAALDPDLVKIHELYVLENTRLADLYRAGRYTPMDEETFIEVTANQLTRLPPRTVIGRLTGDGNARQTLAPRHEKGKISILNGIDRYLFLHDLWQGKYRK